MINFAQTVIDQSQGYPEKIAMRDGVDDLTYGVLCQRILQTANGLKSVGLKKGDHVIIRLDDCIDWPVVFLACLHQGIIPLPLATSMGTELFLKIAKFIDCCAVITNDRKTQESADSILTISRSEIQSFFNSQSSEVDCVWAHPDAATYMNVSSGSTGMPKIAVHRHQTLFEILKLSPYLSFGMTKDSTILSTPKMSWNYGLQNSVTYTLGLGATAIVIPQPPVASVVFDYINQFKPDIVISSPSIIRRLLAPRAEHYILPSSVKHFNASGEHLPAHLYDKFLQRFGIKISCCIGMMETCTNYAANSDFEHDRGTIGKPLPGCKVKLVDGEIYVSSPANACYYYNNYERTRQTFVGEWVRTGDRGRWNEQGNLVFEGRVDDVFKVNDLIVNPLEIENEIIKDANVEQAVVTGIPNTQGVLEAHAFIVAQHGFDVSTLKAGLTTRLSPHQVPKHIHLVSSLPETVNNKQTRKQLNLLDISN